MSSRFSRRGGVLVIALVALAGCGDSAAPATSAPTTSMPTETTATVPQPDSTSPAPAVGLADVEDFEITDRSHTDSPVTYPQDPPAGGPHAGIWQECGFYDQPIGNEHAVHTLEHGAVWITYRPDLPDADIDVLRSLAREPKVLASPYPGLDVPVVATSWGHQLRLPSVDQALLEDFVAEYLSHPDSPEPLATCVDGRGVGARSTA